MNTRQSFCYRCFARSILSKRRSSRHFRRIFPSIWPTLLTTVVGLTLIHPTSASFACSEMHNLINGLSRSRSLRTINQRTIPSQAIIGDHLKICSQNFTCCTEDMEVQLANQSSRDFERRIQDKLIGLRHTFESTTSHFDRLFRDLILKARHELHSMFIQTYGSFYERHSDVFSELFDHLADYYTTGRADVAITLNSFYRKLYRTMFTIMNPMLMVTDETWRCMLPTMVEMEPFGDVPMKMKQRCRRSLVAARTFVQALAISRDVLHRVMEIKTSESCKVSLMSMTYCSVCGGQFHAKPCPDLCLHVNNQCLTSHVQLNADWNVFIDSLFNLLDRLKGPYNLENVINPMNVQISEAIMIFQERGQNISMKVIENCFDLHRKRKRSTKMTALHEKNDRTNSEDELRLKQLQFGGNRFVEDGGNARKLDNMARELRLQLEPTKDIWRSLPSTMCHQRSVSSDQCWNGQQKRLSTDGHQRTIDIDEPSGVITDQILRLRMITNRLNRAYNGRLVDFEMASDGRRQPSTVGNDIDISGSGDDGYVVGTVAKSGFWDQTDDEDLVGQGSGSGQVPTSWSPSKTSATTTVPMRPTTTDDSFEIVTESSLAPLTSTLQPPTMTSPSVTSSMSLLFLLLFAALC